MGGASFTPTGLLLGANSNSTNALVTVDASRANDAIALPRGTIAQRPSGTAGEIRFNTETNEFEGYTEEWAPLGGSEITVQNNNTVVNSTNTLDFQNTPSVTVTAIDDWSNGRVVLEFTSTGGSSGTINVQANGNTTTALNAVANLNFNNTATINVSLSGFQSNTTANIALIANVEAIVANTESNVANSYTQANAAYGAANAAYGAANTGIVLAEAAFGQANSAYAQANTALTDAEDAYGEANSAFALATSAVGYAEAAYAQANTANALAQTASTTANSAYGEANSGVSIAEAAFGQANSAYNQANAAYGAANSGIAIAEAAFAQANSAYAEANAAYAQANTQGTFANGSVIVANVANINFNNTATINVSLTSNTTQTNVALSANAAAILSGVASGNTSNLSVTKEANGQVQIDTRISAGGGGGGNYQVDVLEAGAVIVSNANLNLNNTQSINLLVTANGTTQANLTATLNASLNLVSLNVTANIANTGNLLVTQNTYTGNLLIATSAFINGALFVGPTANAAAAGDMCVARSTTTGAIYFSGFGEANNIYLYYNGTVFSFSGGQVQASSFDSASDEGLKTNISTITNSGTIIDSIDGVNFNWKKDGKASAGVIAQQVQQVFPVAVSSYIENEVSGGTEEYLTVNYNALVAVLIAEVKELRARITELENK